MAGSRALGEPRTGSPGAAAVDFLVARVRAAPSLVLVLDYDGTLVPFAASPELAGPDPELIALLQTLAARRLTEVHIVSGRPGETLESWLGALPIGLHAEHGLSSRAPGATVWMTTPFVPQEWRPAVRELMRAYAALTPSAFVEEKSAGLAWHYRAADPMLGAGHARALELELAALLAHLPASILPGSKVVEVVARGIDKGRLVPALIARAPPGALLLAVGDDRTDEDLFAALPPDALAVHVGPEASRAPIRLDGVAEVRGLLHAIAGTRPG